MTYGTEHPQFNLERAAARKAEIERTVQITDGDPAFRHLVEVRGIPAETVLACLDIRLLRPPITAHAKTEHGVVSLLRPAPDAEPTGVEIAFVDRAGRKTSDRRSWRFTERGCVDAWFWAGGSGDRVIPCEGYLAKPLAALAAGVPGLVVGWGSRSWLGSKPKLPATVKRMLMVPDRRPDEAEVGEDGEPLRAGHDRDMHHAADRWLLELGEEAVALAADPGDLGKDLDEILRAHGAGAVRDLLERTMPATLSEDGWIEKLGGMSPLDYERQRADFAAALGGIRLSTLDSLRKRGLSGDVDEATIREQLIAIALEHEHFVDRADDVFGTIPVAGTRVVGVRVYSTAYRRWLAREYGRRNTMKLPNGVAVPSGAPAQAVTEALDTIAAHAANKPPRDPRLRFAWSPDRRSVYLDLARAEDGAVVEINATGWRVVDWSPVPLVYAEAALPLPIPIVPNEVAAVITELEQLLGFKHDTDEFVLLLGFALHCLMPGGPFILLFITGERGSGKSTRARVVKAVVDPTKVPLRIRPTSRDDLAISAMRQGLPVYDNVSSLPQDMSDALCVILDGGGLGKRRLYSNDEETLIEAQRPVIITAIPDVLRAGDLLERSITVEVPVIGSKIGERAMEEMLERLCPRLLGLICTGVAMAMAAERGTDAETVRRADVVGFVEAAIVAFGIKPGRFREAYQVNQTEAFRGATVSDPVGAAVVQLLGGMSGSSWEGRAQELLTALTVIQRSSMTKLPLGWPRTAHHLTGRLRRLAPDLRVLGIVYTHHRSDGAWVRLAPIPFAREKPNSKSASEASGTPKASVQGGNKSDAAGMPDAAEAYSVSGFPRENSVGNGLDQAVNEVPAGTRCGLCAGLINSEAAEQIGTKWFHADACATEHRKAADPAPSSLSASPVKKRSRVRRGKPA